MNARWQNQEQEKKIIEMQDFHLDEDKNNYVRKNNAYILHS